MKNILMSTAALAAMALVAAAPAKADEPALQLGIGGYISGYAVWTDQEEAVGDSLRQFDFRKDTEVHLSGEVALDNGITAGAHLELLADRSDDMTVEESYLYLSSSWGRVNFGEEDGIAYLLQVAAPSADDKVDGIRPDIGTLTALNAGLLAAGGALDYAHDDSGYSNKLTYITPVFNGFQAGVSYTPSMEPGTTIGGAAIAGLASQAGIAAMDDDDDAGDYQDGWELAARYEGSFDAIDLALGAGYSNYSTEADAAAGALGSDNLVTWNLGATIGWGAFGLGAAYITTNNGVDGAAGADDTDTDTWVAGVDYTTGPYKLGLSYLNSETEDDVPGVGANDQEADRWTAGVIYEWGPGMTFRGAVQFQEVDNVLGAAGTDGDSTQVTLGTQLNF